MFSVRLLYVNWFILTTGHRTISEQNQKDTMCKISTINPCVAKGFKGKNQNLQSGCKPAFNTSHAKLGFVLFFFLYY